MNASTSMNNTLPKASLFYSEGASDKEYHAEVKAVDGGYLVNFRYGRRGATLTCGCKTPAPVDLAQATKVFEKLVKEKTSKGYTPDESGASYEGTEKSGLKTDFVPQLLNAVDESAAMSLILNEAFCAQEKFDGERRAVHSDAEGNVTGMNRKGLAVPLPQAMAEELRVIAMRDGAIRLDGEIIGDVLYVFDLHVERGESLRQSLGWLERMVLARQNVSKCQCIKAIPVAITKDEKRALWDKVKAAGGEGVVFKLRNCTVKEGRPNSGGDWLKFKFTESASCIVSGVNPGKRSVSIKLFSDALDCAGAKSPYEEVGNVTIPPNYDIPEVGDVVEVEYLYAYHYGSLYQPIYRGKRNDIDASACFLAQLKFKPEGRAGDNGDALEPVFTFDDADIDVLMHGDGLSVEDFMNRLGVACDCLGDGLWLFNGAQYDHQDVRAFLKRQDAYLPAKEVA